MDSPTSATYPHASSASAFFLSVFERVPKRPSGASARVRAASAFKIAPSNSIELVDHRRSPTIAITAKEVAKESLTEEAADLREWNATCVPIAHREAIRPRKIIARGNGQSANCWTFQRFYSVILHRWPRAFAIVWGYDINLLRH